MKISKQTIAILKGLAGLNQTFIQQQEGSTLQAITVQKNVVAHATIAESLPPFQVYDLKEFISVLELFDDADVEFGDKGVVVSSGKSRIKYGYCSKELIEPKPPLNAKMPSSMPITFSVTREVIASIQKASSLLGIADVVVSYEDSQLTIGVEGAKNDGNQNAFSVDITDFTLSQEPSVKKARVVFKPEVFRFIPANYEVKLHPKITQFSAKLGDGPYEITYWVGPDAKESSVES